MISLPKEVGGLLQRVFGLFRLRIDRAPITSAEQLREFVSTRAAFVAQTTLFGYVKRRMGINYPAMFHEPLLLESLNIAKMHCFAAGLSDLTIFGVAAGTRGQPLANDERAAMARYIYESSLQEGAKEAPEKYSPQESIAVFSRRLELADWAGTAWKPDVFTESVAALMRWAPIADHLKKLDAEIVENSVKFAWRDVREQFHKRINPAALSADWKARER